MSTHLFSFAREWTARSTFVLALFILVTLVAPMATPPAFAKPQAILTVNPSSGTDSGNCSGSACKTITYALTQAGAGDTINLAAGTYSVTSNGETLPLVPTVDVTIIGVSASTTIMDGGNTTRVMTVNSSTSITLQNVTIQNGKGSSDGNCSTPCGGGILNDSGTLTVRNSTFLGNSASSSGGGIFSIYGTTNVTNSTFVGNSAYYGGGIEAILGTVNVTNSTFSGNSAHDGGGIVTGFSGTVNVTNSTFSGNSATNGGGIDIYPNSYLNYANTIIANSTSGGDCSYSSGTIQTSTNNLVQDGSCLATFSGDPKLGSLASNGGATQTFALLPNSPAIDKGNAATCADAATVNGLDQRGQARDDLQCDIGAYEVKMSDRNYATLNPGTTLRTYGPARAGIQYTGTNPGSSTVTKITTWVSQPASALSVLWDLNATTNTGLDLTLKLCYSTAELRGLTEGDLRFWRYSGGAWSQVGGVPTFSGTSPNRCAQISGVTDLSRWTLATSNPGGAPTSVTLSSFDAKPGFDLGAWLKKFLGR